MMHHTKQSHFLKMAFPNAVDSTHELLDAQAHIWNHVFNFINSMTLKCSIQLGIPDIIHKHGKPITLSQLVDSLSIDKSKSHCIHRIMRILTHSKFFVRVKIVQNDEEEGYWLTPSAHLLLRDEPLSLAPFALAMLDPVLVDPFHHTSEWLINQDECSSSTFATKHGRTIWEHAMIDKQWNKLFNEGMASDAQFVASVLVKDCRRVFEGLKSMVDVGGGTGTVTWAIAEAFPGLECVVLELPHVIDGLEGDGNVRYVGGDMFESIPHADAVFLKWIFHDWSDEESVKILEKCREAISGSKINNGGKVIIVEIVVNDQKEDQKATETQLFFDMLMMIEVVGKERSEKEWAKLFFAAGFKSYKITPVLGLRSVIEVFP